MVKKIVINGARTDQLQSKNFHCCFNAASFIHGATNDPGDLSAAHNHSVLKGLSAEKRIESISCVLADLQSFKETLVEVNFLVNSTNATVNHQFLTSNQVPN